MFAVQKELILNEYLSARDLLELVEGAQERGFSGSGRSDDTDHFSGFDRKIYIAQHFEIAEGFADVFGTKNRHGDLLNNTWRSISPAC